MANQDPNEAFKHFQTQAMAAIKGHFPLKGKLQTLHLDGMEVKDELHPDDLATQHKARVEGKDFAVPVYGNFRLVDNATGKVVDQRKMRMAEIPKMTQRYSYILGGKEYQVDNQWQLKPGIYTRRGKSGELRSQFNTTSHAKFHVDLDPETKQLHMQYGKAKKLPVYPLMKALGVSDDDIERELGRDVLEANKKARGTEGVFEKFYKSDKRAAAPSKEVAISHFIDTMNKSMMKPEANKITLGKPVDRVNGDAFLLASKKLLKVQSGAPEDDRDSLVFKELRGAGDFAHDKIRQAGKNIRSRVNRKLNTATDIRDILKFDHFDKPIKDTFHSNSAARTASQINPLEMLSSAGQTTIMGPGGIQNERAVMDEAKFVNASHMGYMDPINTPEGAKTGVSLRLPMGVKNINKEPHIPLHNLKTGKTEYVPPTKFLTSNVILPDQLEWKDGKPRPIGGSKVRMAGPGNEIVEGDMKSAQYAMKHSSQFFNTTSNLIPFLHNTSGNRAAMASRHMEQAISLVDREAPLVQVGTGTDKEHLKTFEKIVGSQASHSSPAAGTVTAVHKDSIHLKGADGSTHKVHIYNNFPLNDAKSSLHSTPLVKVGDKVKKGQTLADTNYSKNGELALGTNLNVAYIPFKGYNFEDGVVISESAAKKLSSQHLYKHDVPMRKDTVLSKKKFSIHHPEVFKTTQLEHIGDDGVAKVGARVKPGDPLVLAMNPFQLKDRTGINAYRKSVSGSHTDHSLRWEGDVEGEVVSISRDKDKVNVHVKTVEPMQVGDKLTGRYGNKGIVTMVLPDKEMPHTSKGQHVEVALNPSGVPGRMNVGQLLETATSKIAEKTGKPYIVQNFAKGVDMVAHVQKELKQHGLSDTEELHDPVTGQSLGHAMTGKQHILKLVHQVDKKVAVSPGMGLPGISSADKYDLNLQPRSGQRVGALGMYALLAHGAKATIREAQTWKGEGADPQTDEAKRWPSQHNQVWGAIQTGGLLPTPKPTFAFKKFEDLLKGSGINIEKKGHHMLLSPLTDKHIENLTEGRVLPKPAERLEARIDKKSGELKPRKGGLFDEKLTGGHGGTKWSAISLAEPLPNPLFEKPIKAVTGLKSHEFDGIMSGTHGVTTAGHVVEAKRSDLLGGHAIKHLLKKIDVPKALEQAHQELNTAKSSQVDGAMKKVKYLKALGQLGMKADEAYVLHNLPVIPPVMRPASLMTDGNINYADVNELYKNFALTNDQLKDKRLNAAPAEQAHLRKALYDGMQAISGYGVPKGNVENRGLLHQVEGTQPKSGYFQKVVTQKRQDLSMRSTIVPEPAMGLDEVGLPKHHALDLFRPFVVKKLQDMGVAGNPLDAQKVLAKKDPVVFKALEKVMEERPVLLKRDPALHKYSIQGFQPRMVEGNAIKIHPLVTGGFNADFDGDTMSAFVPISREAVDEAHKMKPTNNLFAESTGKVMYTPTLESALGIYKLGVTGKHTKHSFKSPGQILDSVRSKKISHTDVVSLNGKKTTAGRILLASALPEPMQNDVLHNLEHQYDKKGLNKLLSRLGKDHQADFGVAVNKLKDVGNTAAFGAVEVPLPNNTVSKLTDPKKQVFVPIGTHTLSLNDFHTDASMRNKILSEADKKVSEINKKDLSPGEKMRQQIHTYSTADQKMRALHEVKMNKNPNNLFTMYKAGVKPGWDQYKQMVISPMLVKDSMDRILPTPIRNSYSEGLDIGDYWTQMHGARRGAVKKVQQVEDPGALSKLLMNTSMDNVISTDDCGTQRGISLGVHEPDVHDRVLAKDFKAGHLHIKAGTVLTPDLVGQARSVNKNAKFQVRSPLKCQHPQGTCQKCAGLSSSGQHHDLGTNIGVHAAQAVGERAVQLTLKSFHTGGVVEQGGGGKLLNSFARFEQLTHLPRNIPNAAHLAMTSGKIEKIEPTSTGANVIIGGQKHFVGKDTNGNHLHKPLAGVKSDWGGLKVGMKVKAGDFLSDPNRTYMNPHDLYKATKSIDKVQNHLSEEMYNLYKSEGIKRRHVETVVKNMSNLTKVVHPGDSDSVLRGEYQPLSHLQHMNSELVKAGKKPIEHTPILRGVNMLPLDLQEDWMAKLQHRQLRGTLMDAAATAGISNIHGPHPIPGIAYGAEFGLNKQHALRPGMEHLKNVPKHHY